MKVTFIFVTEILPPFMQEENPLVDSMLPARAALGSRPNRAAAKGKPFTMMGVESC